MKTLVKGIENQANGTGNVREFTPIEDGNIDLSKYREDFLRDFRGVSGELFAEDESGEIIASETVTFDDNGNPVWK